MEGALYENTRVEMSLHVFPLTVRPAKNLTQPNVVFICAKSNTLTFRLRRGNMNQLMVNLTPIQGIWFKGTTLNNAVN